MISCHPISDAYRVEAQLLRTFVAVARLGSFSAAAVELGYTQAAVSQQIAALESELKTQLLNRRPVGPTEAGARLLEHAGPILLRLDAARADVARMTSTPAATLMELAPVTATGVSQTGVAVILPAGHPLAGRRRCGYRTWPTPGGSRRSRWHRPSPRSAGTRAWTASGLPSATRDRTCCR